LKFLIFRERFIPGLNHNRFSISAGRTTLLVLLLILQDALPAQDGNDLITAVAYQDLAEVKKLRAK